MSTERSYRDGETRAWHDIPSDWADSFRLGAYDFIDALSTDRFCATPSSNQGQLVC